MGVRRRLEILRNVRASRLAARGVPVLTFTSGSLLVGAAPAPTPSTASSPPSPLDLITEVEGVVNAQSRTEAALLSLDAQVRNGLNGTTGGYVYSLASDAIQALNGPLKELASGVTNAREDFVAAFRHANSMTVARHAELSWVGRCRPAVLRALTTIAR